MPSKRLHVDLLIGRDVLFDGFKEIYPAILSGHYGRLDHINIVLNPTYRRPSETVSKASHAFIRAVETFFYYNLLTRASDLLSQVNSFVKFRANELDELSPHQFTLAPPKIQFTLAIIGLFASVLDITLILDYMDPV
ncbi:hypothetical protein AHF37_09700 [Paragonimus kellicotti]|nr:hypothetical protein AHF37_09700 [Paragonimus kellicotti]